MNDDEDTPPSELHGRLGCAFTWVLVLATPGAMAVGTFCVAAVTGGRLSVMAPVAVVYGWLVAMGLGQACVVGPAVAVALAFRRTRCAAGMGVGALSVIVVNVAVLAFLWATDAFEAVARGFRETW